MTKAEARKFFLDKRNTLTAGMYQQLNLDLYNVFFASVDISFIRHLHIYLPIQKKKEPDTWQIIDRIRREFPHVRLVMPRVTDDGILEHLYFEGLHQLKENAWGIQEPQQGVPADPALIDMVIVPLLAVDTEGNRVGYGKGFYDRFLKECKPSCQKMGLSYFEPVDQIEDMQVFDVKLDSVLTPKGLMHLPVV
jgi:5-formyltetrahydrofolate cyclo-ligase